MKKILRRLGPDPQASGSCAGCHNCPEIVELEGGDYVVVGVDVTDDVPEMPPWLSLGPGERMVFIPRQLLVSAKPNIPD